MVLTARVSEAVYAYDSAAAQRSHGEMVTVSEAGLGSRGANECCDVCGGRALWGRGNNTNINDLNLIN